jgi:hypothetical protein
MVRISSPSCQSNIGQKDTSWIGIESVGTVEKSLVFCLSSQALINKGNTAWRKKFLRFLGEASRVQQVRSPLTRGGHTGYSYDPASLRAEGRNIPMDCVAEIGGIRTEGIKFTKDYGEAGDAAGLRCNTQSRRGVQ